MNNRKLISLLAFFLGFCMLQRLQAQEIFIVRHAEKQTDTTQMDQMMRSDPPLTKAGYERATALANYLKKKKIGYIFITPFSRTRMTAMPTADLSGVKMEFYGPAVNMSFIQRIRSLDQNVLVVGHSNTVDDLVNQLMGQELLQDLPDTEYDRLFRVYRDKKGNWQWENLSMQALKITH